MKIKDVTIPFGEQIRTGTSDSILSGLYRAILEDIGIKDEGRFMMLVNKHVTRTVTPEEFTEISSLRGTLRSILMQQTMTWKVILRGLMVINVIKVDVGLHLYFDDGDMKDCAVMRSIDLDPTTNPFGKDLYKKDATVSHLFKDILVAMNITTNKFNDLIAQYIIKANIPINMERVSSTRGNLKKELLKSTMSWKVLVKGLIFLKVPRFVIGVSLYHKNGKVTNHYRTVRLDSTMEEDDA